MSETWQCEWSPLVLQMYDNSLLIFSPQYREYKCTNYLLYNEINNNKLQIIYCGR